MTFRPDQIPEEPRRPTRGQSTTGSAPSPATEAGHAVDTPPVPQAGSPGEPATLGPGEISCPSCGAANDDDRRFCKKCGNTLPAHDAIEAGRTQTAAAPVAPAKQSWWNKLTGHDPSKGPDRRGFGRKLKDSARGGEAKWRRGLGVRAKAMRFIGLGFVALGAVAMFSPWGGDIRGEIRGRFDDLFGGTTEVTGVTATAVPEDVAVAGYEDPADAVDGKTDQAWATTWDPAAEEAGIPEECSEEPAAAGADLAVSFSSPEDLERVRIYGGLDETLDRDLQRTPAMIDLVVFPSAACVRVELAEEAGYQTFDLDAGNAESVKVIIRTTHPPVSDGTDVVAISDIGFEK